MSYGLVKAVKAPDDESYRHYHTSEVAVPEYDAPWSNGDWEDPYEDLDETEFLESAEAYQAGRY